MKMVHKFLLIITIYCFSFFQCCENKEVSSLNKSNYEKVDLFSDSISNVAINNISLNTINILNNWIEYQELKEVISSLNNNEVSFFKDNKDYIIRFFDGLQKSTPKSIKKPGIISRISVLETKFLILESHFSSNITDEKLEKNRINDIISANSNFIYQIDKLIERSSQIIND